MLWSWTFVSGKYVWDAIVVLQKALDGVPNLLYKIVSFTQMINSVYVEDDCIWINGHMKWETYLWYCEDLLDNSTQNRVHSITKVIFLALHVSSCVYICIINNLYVLFYPFVSYIKMCLHIVSNIIYKESSQTKRIVHNPCACVYPLESGDKCFSPTRQGYPGIVAVCD